MRRRNKISSEQKTQILEELSVTGCSVPQLAKSHGISRSVLYKWTRDNNAINVAQQSVGLENNFVELSVNPITDRSSVVSQVVVADGSKLNLEKASLIFSNFSISLEGTISSGKLISILRTLEEQNA